MCSLCQGDLLFGFRVLQIALYVLLGVFPLFYPAQVFFHRSAEKLAAAQAVGQTFFLNCFKGFFGEAYRYFSNDAALLSY